MKTLVASLAALLFAAPAALAHTPLGPPNGLAVSPDGRTVYYSDGLHARIDAFTAHGRLRAVLGRGRVANPAGLAVGRDGSLFVADMHESRVAVLSARGSLL